jgi:hypothetical protein
MVIAYRAISDLRPRKLMQQQRKSAAAPDRAGFVNDPMSNNQ